MKPEREREREREREILTRYLYSSYTIMLVYVYKTRSEHLERFKISPVKLAIFSLNPKQIATKGFFAFLLRTSIPI